jgi:hypothetical protein
MENDNATPTQVDDIVMPVEMVELQHLKTRAGNPVRVRVEAVHELVIARILGALPGSRDKAPDETGEGPTLPDAEEMNSYSEPLIEAASSLVDYDGSEVRPAFYFNENSPNRHPRSVPGRMLRLEDRTLLVTTILRLSGYSGGAADEASFPDGKRKGGGGGDGAVAAGASDGKATE